MTPLQRSSHALLCYCLSFLDFTDKELSEFTWENSYTQCPGFKPWKDIGFTGMAVTTIGEVRSLYKTMQDWSFDFSGCIWSHLWPMCIVLCCVSHASLSLHAEFQVQRGFILAATPGFDVPGSQGMHQERLCPTGKAWAQVPGHSPYTRHTGI